jgi:ABC-2 type transport system ATP-binding protein
VSLLIADDRSFYPRLTGRQNLDFFAALLGFDAATASARIAQAAELSGVEDLEKPYQECSTGGKQRLALARCLLNEAEVLLLDEPTRSLDAAAAERFRRLIKNELRALGKTVLFTTHDLAEAKSLADRTAALP